MSRPERLWWVAPGEGRDAVAGGRIEAPRVAHLEVVDRVLDVAGGRDGHAHPRVAHAPVQQRLCPRPDAVVGQEPQLAGWRRCPRQGALLERPHEDDAEATPLPQRQQLGLAPTLAGVVGGLYT